MPSCFTNNLSGILNHSIIFFLCGLFWVIPVSQLMGQDIFEHGETMYEQRAANADSFRADPRNINEAIEAFNKSFDQNIKAEQAAAYLLKSYYFKGMYTGLEEDQQQDIYDKGRKFGEKMLERYPNSVPIKFWYGANIGRWADVHGFVKAATSGIAKKLRRVCNDIIEIDPQYQGGGGYRILAQVHFYAPSIPLVMGWPSNDKALELIEKAMSIAPDHPTNRMLYAQILLEFERRDEARQQLRYILDMEPRATHPVEDQYVKHRSQQLLEEHFN
jgi:tetratricopeptide (TPR) repeat protein